MKNRSQKDKSGPKKAKGPGPFKPTIRLPRLAPPVPTPVAHDPAVHPAAPTRKPLEPVTTLAPVLAATEKFAESSQQGLLQQVGREADEALAIGKRVLGMLNVENKNLAFSTSGVTVSYAGLTYDPLASIVQGDTDAQRDGDSIKLKRWNGKLVFNRGGVDSLVAYAFIQEGPTFVTALQQVFEGAGTALAPISQPLWDSRLGFRVLSMHCRALTNNDPFWIVPFDHHFNHDVQYYNNSTTVYEGKVSLILIANITGATSPQCSFDSQMTWLDN